MQIEHIEEKLRETAPELPGELRARVLQYVSRATAMQQSTPRPSRLKLWAPHGWRYAGAMAVIAIICIGLAFSFTPISRPTPAFAQVEQAMQQIKTARWITKRIVTDADGSLIYEFASENWIRLEPPAQAVRMLPETIRTEPNTSLHNTRYVFDRRGQVRYNATTKEYTIDPNALPRALKRPGVDVNKLLRSMMLGHVLFPAMQAMNDKQAPETKGNMKIYGFKSERVTLDGRSLVRFSREVSRTGLGTVKTSIWADPVTNRIVRSETQQIPSEAGGLNMNYHSVNEQYSYDEEPPEGIFDLAPPPGAKVKVISPPDFARSSQKPSPTELEQAQKLINRSEAAWRRGDFKAFAALWDFNFDSKLTGGTAPAGALRRGDWKRRVENIKGRVSRLEARIDPASARLFISNASKSPSAKKQEPDILMVEVISSGEWSVNGKTWKDRRVPYFFSRVNGELRIVNWKILQMLGGSYPPEATAGARASRARTSK